MGVASSRTLDTADKLASQTLFNHISKVLHITILPVVRRRNHGLVCDEQRDVHSALLGDGTVESVYSSLVRASAHLSWVIVTGNS